MDILEKLNSPRTMSMFLTSSDLIEDLNAQRREAAAEIVKLRAVLAKVAALVAGETDPDGLVLQLTERLEERTQMEALALELRELLFDDANWIMRGAMVGSPVECVAFAKYWIQRAKGLSVDADGQYLFMSQETTP